MKMDAISNEIFKKEAYERETLDTSKKRFPFYLGNLAMRTT